MSDRFKPCHAVVSPDAFLGNCIYDMCEYDGMQSTLCDNIEAYAQACKSAGVTISWRNSTFCRELTIQHLNINNIQGILPQVLKFLAFSTAKPCPPNSHFSECTPPCPATCSDLFPIFCHLPPTTCVEGCQCDAGHVLSDNNCVPLEQCGCLDSDREYHDVSVKSTNVYCCWLMSLNKMSGSI